MSDGRTETFLSAAGASNSGTGNQNIYIGVPPPGDKAPLATDSKGRTPRELAKDHLLDLIPRFEPPTGYARAYARLVKHHVVLLDGEQGTGRTATAHVLLRSCTPRGDTFHEIVQDTGQHLLDPEQIGENDRLLLDLSTAIPGRLNDVRHQLGSFATALVERHAALVVILPPGSARGLPSFLHRSSVLLERPPDAEIRIVRRFLRLSGSGERETTPLPASFKRFVEAKYSLEEVARFAAQVTTAVTGGTSFTTACDTANALLADRSGEAASTLLGTVRDTRTRGLFIASALLEGARSDAVHEAARALHTGAGGEAGTSFALATRPLSERLRAIGARIDSEGRVRCTKPGMSEAVARQVWRDFPDLRNTLRGWVATTLALPRLDEPEREALVLRFAALSLREGHHGDLKSLAVRWARSSWGHGQRAAVRVLGAGLGHPAAAREFREHVLERARQETLAPPERRVLIAVCRDDLAVHHPFAAVVRLQHLTRREGPGRESGDALMSLVTDDPRLLRFLLGRLTQIPGEEHHRAADRELFLRCAVAPLVLGPGPGTDGTLAAEPAVRAALVTGWSEVLAHGGVGRWGTSASRWFGTAIRDGDPLGLVDILFTACRERTSLQGLLYQAALRWAAGQPVDDTAASALPPLILRRVRETLTHRAARLRETSTP